MGSFGSLFHNIRLCDLFWKYFIFFSIDSRIVHYTHQTKTLYIYIYIYIVIVIVIFIWWSPFIPSRNLDEVFTYNHMALISLRSPSHVKALVVLTRSDHICINNFIISLLNIILRPILMVQTRLEPVSYCLCVWLLSQLSHVGSFHTHTHTHTYIYIYIYNIMEVYLYIY